MRFYYERVENSRNFANKVWNASRFIMMNMEGSEEWEEGPSAKKEMPVSQLQPVDKWILSRLNDLVKEVTDNMENYELGIAVQKVYDFIWDEFCDWYIEMVKPRLYQAKDGEDTGARRESREAALWTLKTVLIDALKLLHPYMPFITEEIFCTLQSEEESIMISSWPVYTGDRHFEKEEKDIDIIKEAVRGIRNVRSEMNVAPGKKTAVFVVSEREDILTTFTEGKLFFASLASANEVTMIHRQGGNAAPQKETQPAAESAAQNMTHVSEEAAAQSDTQPAAVSEAEEDIAKDSVSVVIPGATLYIPLADLVDIAQEIERLKKEQKRLEGELARVNGMLSNERFISRAPEVKIAQEREKLAKYTQMMEQVTQRLGQLQRM